MTNDRVPFHAERHPNPRVRSPIEELEAAAMGDAAERAALDQTWHAFSQLLATHDQSAAVAVANRRRRLGPWLRIAASLSLSVALIGGLVWIEHRSQRTMARWDKGRVTTRAASPRASAATLANSAGVNATPNSPPNSPPNATPSSVASSVASSAASSVANLHANVNADAKTGASGAALATLWDDELDTQLGEAREQLESLRSAWRAPSDRLSRLADDLSERLRMLQSDWSEDTL